MYITDLYTLSYNLYYPYTRCCPALCVGFVLERRRGHALENKRSRGLYCGQMREGGPGVDTKIQALYTTKCMCASEAQCVQQHSPLDLGGVAWGGAGTGVGQRWSWGRHL